MTSREQILTEQLWAALREAETEAEASEPLEFCGIPVRTEGTMRRDAIEIRSVAGARVAAITNLRVKVPVAERIAALEFALAESCPTF